MRDVNMHDKVRIKETNEIAFIVWFNEENDSEDSYLLEKNGKEEFPTFYRRKDFEVVGE